MSEGLILNSQLSYLLMVWVTSSLSKIDLKPLHFCYRETPKTMLISANNHKYVTSRAAVVVKFFELLPCHVVNSIALKPPDCSPIAPASLAPLWGPSTASRPTTANRIPGAAPHMGRVHSDF